MSERKVRVVALDETYGLDEAVKAKTGRLLTLYVYDPELGVHCCEVTPSHELVPFEFVTENEIDDDLHGDLMVSMNEEPAVYMHCSVLQRLPDDHHKDVVVEIDDDKLGDEFPLVADLAAEELRANPEFPARAMML